ncbi:hypothetical protein G7050_02815 [Dysgonomonas sp. HDW5A]|uniref:hypothetical protein n=1 Tax=Dysgonomonas sp. HDW5A TaxID=2714926 RepID=UPI001407E7E1|nr:hypothetical protein [Dysgonomonas sp. HDW5A]QIK58829.1 hypothetical protein G7050_02815 [Dysgonomonas sp. HDW5A]
MSWVIIKKENDLWNIWSTNTDGYILGNDCSLDELEIIVASEEIEATKQRVKRKFDLIKQGNKLHFKTEDEL